MQDPFKEFGGIATPQTAVESDPFAEFGGKKVATPTVTPPVTQQPDPFSEFGGVKTDESPQLKRYAELKDESSKYGLGDLVLPSAIKARGTIVGSRSVPDSDVEAVAAAKGVNPEELKAWAPFFVAMPPPEEASLTDWAKGIAGRAGYAAANIPQFAAKKLLIDDPKMREALDEVRELGEGRMGAGEWAAYNVLPAIFTLGVSTEARAAVTALGAAAKGSAVGAVSGLAGSREGQEVQSAAVGAVLGGGLGAIAGKLAGRKAAKAEAKAATSEAEDLALDYVKNNEADITKSADEAYTRVAESEDTLANAALNKAPIDERQAKVIVEQQLAPDTVEVVKDSLISDYRKANKGVAEIPDEVTSDLAVATKYMETRKEKFANELADEVPDFRTVQTPGGGARAATTEEVIEQAGRLGKERLSQKWKESAYTNVAIDQIKKEGIKVRADEAPIGKILVDALGDRQFGLKVLDEKTGVDTLPEFLKLNANYNRFTIDKKNYYSGNKRLGISGLKDVYNTAKKIPGIVKDLTSDIGGKMYKAIDTRDFSGLSPEEQKAATQVVDFFDSIKNRANTMTGEGISPLAIPKREDFGLPNMMVRPVDYAIKMNQRFAELSQSIDLAKLSKEQLSEAAKSDPRLREFIDGINLTRPEVRIADGNSLVRAYKEATNRGATNPRLHTVASTALGRRESIPEFLREKNVFKLMDRYLNNTLKNVYTREPLDALTKKAAILDKMGATTEAKYVRRLVADNLGMRSYSMARLGTQARIGFANAVDTALSKVVADPEKRQRMVAAMATLPELAANLQYNIYPNVLGLNPKSHIAQLTQVLFKTAPELGGTYGYQSAVKSYLTTALRGKDLVKKVREYGLEPAAFTKDSIDALAEGIEKSAIYKVPASAVRGMARVFMKTYSAMDTLNRAATIDMSERLVRDVASGDKGAMKAVSKMPLAVKRLLVENTGNAQEQSKVIAQYLNSSTQFNYNRASMSELGTIVGPLFSTFTKWPLATAGDIAADLRTKGFTGGGSRTLEKYAAVWLLAQAADSLLYAGMTGDVEISPDFKEAGPRTQKMIGRGGITSMSPIESIRPLLGSKAQDKSLITPPIIDALYKTMTPLLEGDTEAASKAGMKALSTFTPGGFLWNFTMGTLPKLALDEDEW